MPNTVRDLVDYLREFAPTRLAEDWDNVGLLVGDATRPLHRVMTCLTVTPESVAEAVREQADLIVTHHPMPFRPLKRITTDDVPGRLLLEIIGNGISIYSPHTAFDSAARGINQRLAEGLELDEITPLDPFADDADGLGAGRWGRCRTPLRLDQAARRVMKLLRADGLHCVGEPDRRIERIAVACGAAGTFLASARRAGCELLVTGETNFHTCLEAEATGVCLLLPGHFASERFAVEQLADVLDQAFSHLTVWAARDEHDPLHWVGSA